MRLTPNGLILIDDMEHMNPISAFPWPRPYGKGSFVVSSYTCWRNDPYASLAFFCLLSCHGLC